ncbi:hypothetical protein [Blastococcus sp. SYSU DS0617]
MSDPWSDPAEPAEPYPGPPQTAPQQPSYGQQPPYGPRPPYGQPPGWAPPYGAPEPWGQPAWGQPQWGQPPYGQPPYGQPPYGQPWGRPPVQRTPAQVITAAVLAFVQAVVVLIASLYVWFFASIADIASSGRPDVYTSETARQLATEGTILAVVQLLSVVLLVVGGVVALNRRTPVAHRLLGAAHVVQVVLALYWAGRLLDLLGNLPGAEAEGSLAAFSLFFVIGPVVSLGLLLSGAARRWFTGTPPA